MDARSRRDRRGGACVGLPARQGRVGLELDRGVPRGSRRRPRHERCRNPCIEEAHPERVRLVFRQSDGATKEARVPAGTTLFDCASWNGIAIDSTCGGHGTCKKCKVRVSSGEQAVSTRRPARVLAGRAARRLAARVPRAGRARRRRRGAAAADAAEGRARRRRPARDPAAGRAEALPRARRADARGPDVRPRARARGHGRRRAPRAARRSCARSAGRCATSNWKVTAVFVDDLLDRRRAGRHERPAATRSPTTSARRPSSRRSSTSRPGSRLRCARC